MFAVGFNSFMNIFQRNANAGGANKFLLINVPKSSPVLNFLDIYGRNDTYLILTIQKKTRRFRSSDEVKFSNMSTISAIEQT